MGEGSRPVESFTAELNRAWRAAGPPSFADVERLSGQIKRPVEASSGLRVMVLAASTTHAILTGQRRGLPKWQRVASLITVLRSLAAQGGRDPDNKIGTLEEWKAKYDAAAALLEQTNHGLAPVEESAEEAFPAANATITQREAGLVPSPRAAGQPLTAEDGQDARRSVLTLVKQTRALGWWHDFHDVVPDWLEGYLSLEPAASQIRTYETRFISGLLQTPDYAEAVIRLEHRAAPTREISRRVGLQMRRQEILHKPNAPRLWAIVDEAMLRRPLGGQATMRGQIRHLIAMSDKPHITVQILPSGHPGQAGAAVSEAAGGPVTILRFAESELPDVVYLEQDGSALYPDKPGDVHHYVQVLTRLGIEAEKRAPTIEILHRILTDL